MPFLRPLARIWTILLGLTALALMLGVAARAVIPATPFAPIPALTALSPPAGAVDVRPRTLVTLRFSEPMNRVSTERALRFEPATPGTFSWSPDSRLLTFRPAAPLTPAVTYTVTLGAEAQSRWWRSLAEPAIVQFRTAPQPAVVAALPATDGVADDTVMAVIFSQPMIPAEGVGLPAAAAILRLDPPVEVRGRWLDQQTLLVHPVTRLAPATRYRATISPGLVDVRGVELGEPFSWRFSTGWPAITARSPEPGARWVGPRTPLSLTLAAPLRLDQVRQALRITPAVEGDLEGGLPGSTQVITFTPRNGWAYDTSYVVTLDGSGSEEAGTLWSFSVAPQPRLVAYFPGQGQILPPGEAIRLVFSTPMDEQTLRAGLRVEPAVDELPITVSGTEVRLRPELAPSTLYTITLAAETTDRAGEPLGAEAVMRLRTAPARPALSIPGASDGIVTLPVSRAAVLELEATNLSALDLSLYPIDQPTLLRALALPPEQWAAFSPERYGQVLARRWRVSPGAPVDQPARLRVPVGLVDGEALGPGAYYVRMTTPESPRADLILLVSDLRLTLRYGPDFAVAWTTGPDGAPVGGQPVVLYSGGTLVARGRTDAAGIWTAAISGGEATLLAVADGGELAISRSDWLIAPAGQEPPVARSLLFADRLAYSPGERLTVRGLTRLRERGGGLALPTTEVGCRMQLRTQAGVAAAGTAPCAVDEATGALSGTVQLGTRLTPGDYTLAASVGDESLALPIRIVEPAVERFDLEVAAVATDTLQLRALRGGQPLPGALIDWRVRLESAAMPVLPEGFVLDLPIAAMPAVVTGGGVADSEGRLTVTLPADTSVGAAAYRLQATTPANGVGQAAAEVAGTLGPGPSFVAIRLPRRLVTRDERTAVELLAIDRSGRPLPGTRLRIEVFRADAPGGPVLTRQAIAGPDGRASVQLVQLRPGEYEIVTAAGEAATRVPLWVYDGRFTGWRANAGQFAIVTDRERYSPGDVASVLLAAPAQTGGLLLTVEQSGLRDAESRLLSAGQVITLPITADMAPGIALGAVVDTGSSRLAGSAALLVDGQRPPFQVGVAPATVDVLAGATLPLTVTTGDGAAPLAADLLITIAPEQVPSSGAMLGRFVPGAPPPSVATGLGRNGQASPDAPPHQVVMLPAEALTGFVLNSGAPGVAAGTIQLPDAPGRWRITAYGAAGADRIAAGSTVVTTSLPLAYSFAAPDRLAPGDRAAAGLLVRNTSPTTSEVRIRLSATGLAITPPGRDELRLTLAPGGTQAIRWHVATLAGATEARLRLALAAPGLRETLSKTLAITAPVSRGQSGPTLIGSGPLSTSVSLQPVSGGATIALAPGLHAALADQAEALAMGSEPTAEDHAALAIIAAELAREAPVGERSRWERHARNALAALEAAQDEAGGWGWWPHAPAQPFVTAFVLEAQTAARQLLGDTRPPSLRALAYLGRTVPELDPDTRAYVAYVLARAGRPDTDLSKLPPVELGPDGLAFLALAMPAAQSAPLLDRLASLAERTAGAPGRPVPVRWTAPELAGLPRSELAVTAAATQALRTSRPGAVELPGAESTLLGGWGVDGWATSYEAARVAMALLPGRGRRSAAPTQVTVAGTQIFGAGPFSTTVRAELTPEALPERPALVVRAPAASLYLIAQAKETAEVQAPSLVNIDQDLLDPATGAPLDPSALRTGQLVALRTTVVIARPLLRAELAVVLPAGLTPVVQEPRAPFLYQTSASAGVIRLGAAPVAPGVYTHIVQARAAVAGQFSAPPARLIVPDEAQRTAVGPAGLAITVSE